MKPYRLLISQEESLKGSDNTLMMEDVLNWMKNWEIQRVELLDNQASNQQINDYIKDQIVLLSFFQRKFHLKHITMS